MLLLGVVFRWGLVRVRAGVEREVARVNRERLDLAVAAGLTPEENGLPSNYFVQPDVADFVNNEPGLLTVEAYGSGSLI